jgi:hypothetical protein
MTPISDAISVIQIHPSILVSGHMECSSTLVPTAFESFLTFVNFPVVHVVIAIFSWLSSMNFTSFKITLTFLLSLVI